MLTLTQNQRDFEKSRVAILKSNYDSVYKNLRSASEMLGELIPQHCNMVSIKINLCDARTPETGAITHPLFLDALLKFIREKIGYSVPVNVVECDATVASPDLFMKWFGFFPILEKYDAKYVNLLKDKKTWKNLDGLYFKRIAIPNTIARSDFLISLSKLKTHSLTKITCSLKNQFGCIPYRRKVKFHPHLDEVIVDATLAMRPHLSIVDGIIAQTTSKGPIFGKPLPANIMILGRDPVAVDSCCAKILGFNPYFVAHLRKAEKAKIGRLRYNVLIKGFSKSPQINSEFSSVEPYLGKFIRLFKKKQ